MADVLAAVDVGTNSFHLVVARVDGNGHFEVIEREKEMVRLGSGAGSGDQDELDAEAIDRGLAALERFRRIARISGASLRAVATSAVRESCNAEEFLRRARDEAGVEVEVISGLEEARLIHLGVLQAVPVFDQRILVIDIGGGSTEVLIGEQGRELAAASHRLGAIRLTRRFFKSGRLHPGAVDACRRHVRGKLVPIARDVARHGFEVTVGASGTIEAVAAMAHAHRGDEPPRTFNGYELATDDVRKVVKRLVKAGTVERRREIPGLEPKRADIILAGAIILEQALLSFGVDRLIISDYALREGALLDSLQRADPSGLHHLRDLRRRSISHLAELMDEDPAHSDHVAELALDLFDGTVVLHGLGAEARELLEGGARLANVGQFVAHSRHHKHSYYVIRNSEHLLGFTDREIEVLALLARYHRRGAPSSKHPEFDRLRTADQRMVRTLAAILRVAIGLDRSYSGLVRGVRCTDDGRVVRVELRARAGADLSLELHSAGERRELLEEVLGREVCLVVAER